MLKRTNRLVERLAPEELQRRARWGGVGDIPALTSGEQAEWQAIQEASSDWVPQRALACCWASVDPIHGSRPWSRRDFAAALAADQRQIARVTATHPAQARRLQGWIAAITALARERDGDTAVQIGRYYEQLSTLGYAPGADVATDDDPAIH